MNGQMPRQAMVLAAGLGQRMRPLTDTLPKPLILVAGRSLVDRAIDRLEEAGVKKVVVNTFYKAELLEAHLSKRKSPRILFSREEAPLETGGGVAQALPHFAGEPFFAVNGDVIWLNGRVSALERLASHWHDGLDALLLLHPVAQALGYGGEGDFRVNAAGHLARRSPEKTAPYVYAGVQLLHPRLFEGCPKGRFSLNLLYDKALQASPPRMGAVVHDGGWLHVGDLKGLAAADAHLAGTTS
jgi:MurNAc alpha-1-phosphate uridylyltransferase